jgi:hypothetical protein
MYDVLSSTTIGPDITLYIFGLRVCAYEEQRYVTLTTPLR